MFQLVENNNKRLELNKRNFKVIKKKTEIEEKSSLYCQNMPLEIESCSPSIIVLKKMTGTVKPETECNKFNSSIIISRSILKFMPAPEEKLLDFDKFLSELFNFQNAKKQLKKPKITKVAANICKTLIKRSKSKVIKRDPPTHGVKEKDKNLKNVNENLFLKKKKKKNPSSLYDIDNFIIQSTTKINEKRVKLNIPVPKFSLLNKDFYNNTDLDVNQKQIQSQININSSKNNLNNADFNRKPITFFGDIFLKTEKDDSPDLHNMITCNDSCLDSTTSEIRKEVAGISDLKEDSKSKNINSKTISPFQIIINKSKDEKDDYNGNGNGITKQRDNSIFGYGNKKLVDFKFNSYNNMNKDKPEDENIDDEIFSKLHQEFEMREKAYKMSFYQNRKQDKKLDGAYDVFPCHYELKN